MIVKAVTILIRFSDISSRDTVCLVKWMEIGMEVRIFTFECHVNALAPVSAPSATTKSSHRSHSHPTASPIFPNAHLLAHLTAAKRMAPAV